MSPRTIEVHPLRLFAQTSHARMMADHGIGLARNGGKPSDARLDDRAADHA